MGRWKKETESQKKNLQDRSQVELHSSWVKFMDFCGEVRYGTIEVKLAEGLPVRTKHVTRKIKFD